MDKIPFWKIKRELKRLRPAAKRLSSEMFRKLYFRRYYDLVTKKKIRLTIGSNPLYREAAINLIYPETGIQESHLFMLREMQREGISAIVVSNLPLSDKDRKCLETITALIIERPNVGYDFGGYRDGILEIVENLSALDRLWLLNDSVWMVPRRNSWFAQARALNLDYTAATSSFSISRKSLHKTKRAEAADYRQMDWQHQPGNSDFHYGSYAMCFGKKILQDYKFIDFWRRLEIRNDKKITVQRGEIGVTQWVMRNGYTHGATHEIDKLPQELETLDDATLEQTTRELTLFKNCSLTAIKPKVLQTDLTRMGGRAERIGLILIAVAQQGSAYALALYYLRHTNFPFLKKSILWLSADGTKSILNALEETSTGVTDHVVAEARQISERRLPSNTASTNPAQ